MKKVSERIDQAKQIVESRVNALPVDEKWYQERLAVCSGCPHNSHNVPEENKTTAQKVREKVTKERYCIACKCPIDHKASIKRAICGLKEIGETPLWGALSVEMSDEMPVSLIHNGPTIYSIEKTGDGFMVDLGKTDKPVIEFSMRFFHPKQNPLISAIGTCSCTATVANIVDENHSDVAITLSTESFNTGAATIRNVRTVFKGLSEVIVSMKVEKIK